VTAGTGIPGLGGPDAEAVQVRMPEGTHLAYSIFHESEWWPKLCVHNRPNEGRRSINILASATGGGCQWEFAVVEFELSSLALHLEMFADSWQAFEAIPEFFAALASGEVNDLSAVVSVLDGLGAVDETDRGEVR
jgi:hypothetical protein